MRATSRCSFETTASGVPAGAISAYHDTAAKPGRPAASATVGTSGRTALRSALAIPSARSSPASIRGFAVESWAKIIVTSPRKTSVKAGDTPR